MGVYDGMTRTEQTLTVGSILGVGAWIGLMMSAWKNENRWLAAGLGAVPGAMQDYAMRRKLRWQRW